jgi:hypothetical protein
MISLSARERAWKNAAFIVHHGGQNALAILRA